MKLSVGLVETRSPTGLSINVAPEHSAGMYNTNDKERGEGGDSFDYYWLLMIPQTFRGGARRHAPRIAPGIKCGGVAGPANSTTEVFSPGVVILTIMREHQQQGTIIMPSRMEPYCIFS